MNHETVQLDKRAIGLRLYEIFRGSDYSYEQIAEILGLASSHVIYDWMSGKKMPSTERIVNISLLMGVSIESILI